MRRMKHMSLWSESCFVIFGFMCKNQVIWPSVQCWVGTLHSKCCFKKDSECPSSPSREAAVGQNLQWSYSIWHMICHSWTQCKKMCSRSRCSSGVCKCRYHRQLLTVQLNFDLETFALNGSNSGLSPAVTMFDPSRRWIQQGNRKVFQQGEKDGANLHLLLHTD